MVARRTVAPTLAVAGGKGGCGKTTTALGLAAEAVRRGAQPLVVDADVDVPDLHVRAGVDREPGLPAVAAGERPARVVQASPHLPGVDVIAAGTRRARIDAALERLAGLDRPVLVDSPAGAGPDAAAPLRAASASVLVSTTSPESVEDARKTARMARALDAPPVAVALRATDEGVPDPRVAGAPAVAVPTVTGAPLGDRRVRAAYDRLWSVVADDSPR